MRDLLGKPSLLWGLSFPRCIGDKLASSGIANWLPLGGQIRPTDQPHLAENKGKGVLNCLLSISFCSAPHSLCKKTYPVFLLAFELGQYPTFLFSASA